MVVGSAAVAVVCGRRCTQDVNYRPGSRLRQSRVHNVCRLRQRRQNIHTLRCPGTFGRSCRWMEHTHCFQRSSHSRNVHCGRRSTTFGMMPLVRSRAGAASRRRLSLSCGSLRPRAGAPTPRDTTTAPVRESKPTGACSQQPPASSRARGHHPRASGGQHA